ncbi:MAG TPA: radical SAM protein [Vicinamibacterales bacterium]|nr:radical SAM protein [Vicinamibacterales bacterium]
MLHSRTYMNVLLLRPVPANERFGLGPFFRIEPLGMEYIAAALEGLGHTVTLADLRFSRLAAQIRAARPEVVGIAAMHALETDEVVALARRVRALAPDVPIVVGGHTAAAYPEPFLVAEVAAVVVDDGERTFPLVCDAIARREPLTAIAGLALRDRDGAVVRTAGETGTLALDEVPLPARRHVAAWRRQYACLAHRPAWLVETARGCPFRCSFCSIWQLHQRAVRERSIDAVCRDFDSVGDHIFVADDLFWHHPSRSLELAHELRRRGIAKQWILVQSRTDLVGRHPELLEAWRPLAKDFDIFFGLEAATDEGLDGLMKDATVDETMQGVAVARAHHYGVTGNFVIDPAWTESDFEKLWAFVERHQLFQAGFTILTPLPGTKYFDDMRQTLRARRWSHFDMHHLLWEPRLGPRRFFELYCETWRRSVLNLKGRKGLLQWLREVDLSNALFLIQALRRTQKLMDAEHYLKEYDLASSVDELLGTTGGRSLTLRQV